MQDSSGNRIATCLIYLNDVDSGGTTTFKDLNIQVIIIPFPYAISIGRAKCRNGASAAGVSPSYFLPWKLRMRSVAMLTQPASKHMIPTSVYSLLLVFGYCCQQQNFLSVFTDHHPYLLINSSFLPPSSSPPPPPSSSSGQTTKRERIIVFSIISWW